MRANIHILVPADWTNTKRGEYLEDLVAALITRMRFRVVQRVRFTGMEIDCLAENLDSKEQVYVECKFLKDPFESEILSKMIGNAIQRDIEKAYLFSTAQPSKDAKGVLEDIARKGNLIRGILRFAFVGPEEFVDLYTAVHSLETDDVLLSNIPPTIRHAIGGISLVVVPEEAFWVVEITKGGVPEKAYLIPATNHSAKLKDYDTVKRLIAESKLWVGLPLENGILQVPESIAVPNPVVNVVTSVPSADKFDDYRPARPEDFVGRTELLAEVIALLQQVSMGKNKSRVMAISGLSGFGKSSIVLNLANQCRESKLNEQFYICPIDTRSAVSPLFIAEAVRYGFQRAINDSFLSNPSTDVSIESVENPFSSESMINLITQLSEKNKIIVLFFDQFEELFVKESLFDTFEAFRRFAYNVESLQSNIILGFSWRTGISIPDTHPAHYIWHELRDRRVEFKIGPFTEKEASALVGGLERAVAQKIEPALKRHLIEQSQYLPWLLKKFCVHIFRKLQEGFTQRELVGSQLDAETLFNDDMQSLQPIQIDCLKYIASNSPADVVDVHDKYGHEIPERLYSSRLIIRSGHRYSVYWDIFREFLVTGKVPTIPITHIPQSQLSTSLNVFRYIREEGPVSLEVISSAFNYTLSTTQNIIASLSAFFLIDRTSNNQLKVVGDLVDADDNAIADYLAYEMSKHVVYISLKNLLSPGQSIWFAELSLILFDNYPFRNPDTLRKYANRLLPWLEFCGLLEIDDVGNITRPAVEGKGRKRGIVPQKRSNLIDGRPVFVCSASPKRVVDLAYQLYINKELTRAEVEGNANRNAALDLSALGLAQWNNGKLAPIGTLKDLKMSSISNIRMVCYDLVKNLAVNSKFLSILIEETAKHSPDHLIFQRILQELTRDWTYESVLRYTESGRSWLSYFKYLEKLRGQQSFDFLDDVN